MKNQMITMLYQINNNLDYFGNPPGWVPMLSFEALTETFKKEVDNSIYILYLQYWLGNKGQMLNDARKTLIQARATARQTIINDQEKYKSEW
jgi:hypothetical protein